MANFNEFGLRTKVLESISNIGFTKPTSIQEKVLPFALENKSLACKGKTGSGKTHSYLIPIANKIVEANKNLQAIIIVPTRELAIQINQRTKEMFDNFDIKISLLVGGIDTNREKEKITSIPQIVIGTPEKICEVAIENGLLNLSTVKTLVIDEADMTLEMGFLNEVDRIAYLCKTAQMMLFSATIPAGIKQFIRKYFSFNLIIEEQKDNSNANIEHILYPIRSYSKEEVLLKIINFINPYVCLIFANRKEDVEKYHKFLVNNGVDCGIIHGDLEARERKTNIKRALDGKYKYIVCSDIAARGIDIDGVSHVISIDFPKNNLEFYTHRAGRAGRINYLGQAISLYAKDDAKTVSELEAQGIIFNVKELKNGEWVELKEFDARKKRKVSGKDDPLQQMISKTVRMTKSKNVKPNYKKKVKAAVDKVKRKHRREVIQNDIKKRIVQRAIARTKGEE